MKTLNGYKFRHIRNQIRQVDDCPKYMVAIFQWFDCRGFLVGPAYVWNENEDRYYPCY